MKPVQTSIRLADGQKEQLEAIAKKTGIEVSNLVRQAIEELIKYAQRNGGRVIAPIDFGERLIFVEKCSVLRSEDGASEGRVSFLREPVSGNQPHAQKILEAASSRAKPASQSPQVTPQEGKGDRGPSPKRRRPASGEL